MQKALDIAAVVLAALLVVGLAFVSVRGLIDPQQASLRFGFPVSDAAGALFYRVYLSRNLVIVAASAIFLISRQWTPLAVLLTAAAALPVFDMTALSFDGVTPPAFSQARARAARNCRRAALAPFARKQILSEPFTEETMADLTEPQARALIAPWYSLFNIATRGDVRAVQEAVLTEDYESCAGYLPGECWGRETSIKVVSNFARTIPDMKFAIREVLVAGDRVIVRGEVTGMPSGELFGVPHGGKSFRIMAVDIQTIRDGKIAKTYHMENWLSAIGQLRAK
jgi:hypothetical protein